MRHVHPHQLAASRRAQSQASFTAVELAAAQQRARAGAEQARQRLRDAITATGLPAFQGMAILAAAESYANAATACVASLPSPEPEPAAAATAGKAGAQ